MPIYEYKCLDCGLHLEKMQKVSEESLKLCEKCGGKLEKQWSLSGFQFKGAGWYVTDYAKKTGNADKSEKSEKTDKAEKSSATESTATAETASNESNDDTSGSKKEVKKD